MWPRSLPSLILHLLPCSLFFHAGQQDSWSGAVSHRDFVHAGPLPRAAVSNQWSEGHWWSMRSKSLVTTGIENAPPPAPLPLPVVNSYLTSALAQAPLSMETFLGAPNPILSLIVIMLCFDHTAYTKNEFLSRTSALPPV